RLRCCLGGPVFCGRGPNDGRRNCGGSAQQAARARHGGSSTERKSDGKENSADQDKREENGQHAAGAKRNLRILLRRGHRELCRPLKSCRTLVSCQGIALAIPPVPLHQMSLWGRGIEIDFSATCYFPAGAPGVGTPASNFCKPEKKSIGTGNTTVVFFSTPISVSVCRYRNWMLAGSEDSRCAASTRRWAAENSPSAWMIFDRFSRSASACLAMARSMDSGISTCLTSTLV